MKKVKYISFCLAIAMILSNFTMASALDRNPGQQIQIPQVNEENIRVIIELKDKPILNYAKARRVGAKNFLSTNEAQDIKEELVGVQAQVKTDIVNHINPKAQFKYSYTNTLNGFVAEVKRDDIKNIKNLDNVKKVYIDVVYSLPKPQPSSSSEMISPPKYGI